MAKTYIVSRTDKIGDLVLSTPVFQAIKEYDQYAKVYLLVRHENVPVVQNNPYLDGIIPYYPNTKHSGFWGTVRLIKELRNVSPDVCIFLFTKFQVALAGFFSGASIRVGPLSKLHSFLFFNKGKRQKRSLVEMHEAEYNLNLLMKAGIDCRGKKIPTTVVPTETALKEVKAWLEKEGIAHLIHHDVEHQISKKTILIHPGMGGSALNWPESSYKEITEMLAPDYNVICGGGFAEKDLIARIVGHEKSIKLFVGETLEKYIALINQVDLVIAPSTGPIHLAVAMNKKVVSFYPPIRVQSVTRWGPYPYSEKKMAIHVPDLNCMEDFKCKLELCNYYPCMKSISAEDVLESIKKLLKEEK